MNTLAFIKRKLNLIDSEETVKKLKIILNHLEVAEKHFISGINDCEIDLFNDAIYRTNQAYEGILRLAYENILEKPEKNKTNIEIEKTLLQEKIINERTKNYISLYRGDFRNSSIHNYQLRFNESDAFMAINNTTSILYTLINQLLIHDAYLVMKEKNHLIEDEVKVLIHKNLNFIDLLKEALLIFPNIYFKNPKGSDFNNGFYIIGELQAYLEKINSNWKITILPGIEDMKMMELLEQANVSSPPDLIIEHQEEMIRIDICTDKDFHFRKNFLHNIEQSNIFYNVKQAFILQLTEKTEYTITQELKEPILVERIHPIKERKDKYE